MWILDTKRRQPALVASDSIRAIARAKEMEDRRGRGKEESFLLSPPLPLHSPCLLSSRFSRRTRAETLATQAKIEDVDMRVFQR